VYKIAGSRIQKWLDFAPRIYFPSKKKNYFPIANMFDDFLIYKHVFSVHKSFVNIKFYAILAKLITLQIYYEERGARIL